MCNKYKKYPLLANASLRYGAQERRGVEKALAVIRDQKRRLRGEGFNKLTHFLGVLNVGFTSFFLGYIPHYFWVWQTVKTTVLTALLAVRRFRTKTLLYWLDFCWVMNKLFIAVGVLALLNVCHGFTSNRTLLRALFAVANGPLAWSVALTSNALIFHSIDQLGALFIHISPPLMSWTFRWYPEQIEAVWPGRFALSRAAIVGVSWCDMYLPALGVYLLWWAIYTPWLCLHGVHLPRTGWRTVFQDFCEKQKVHERIERRFGVKGLGKQALVYMGVHLSLAAVLLAWPLVLYQSYALHTGFLIGMVVVSAWNGSGYYSYKMADAVERAVMRVVREHEKEEKGE